ncbi:MAG: hypothetical protein A2Y64_01270 [Candidatus Coatesbacteria bacterium RBG_13_66_14]|uniref:Uncharacterized protein n=1 Tax=Candidatus Coatesbacteria bacterium RBG_13_66_14 TaxID=1817816 RepID=A0A1F5FEL1_9BACT|nr:MAG: hypothetical protein A2Y64_01270 [Candidatus Coatesbacteria bacterium RBG_13_66_14]
MAHPPSVDAVRRAAVEREPGLGALPGGLLTGLCRLALRPGPVNESAAEAVRRGRDLLGKPSGEKLPALTTLLAAELYGLPAGDIAPCDDPARGLAAYLLKNGARRVWLCRGQKLTLADGRRLADVLTESGLEAVPFGTTNRCLAGELAREWASGDGAVWAASGGFRLAGFVEHLGIGELAATARGKGGPAAVLLDDWLRPAPQLAGLPTFIIPAGGPGFAVGTEPGDAPPEDRLRHLFELLRKTLLGG